MSSKATKPLSDLSHSELVNALTRIEELDEALPVLSAKKMLTGKLLSRCNNVTDLVPLGFEEALIAPFFFEEYFTRWKNEGVPLRMIAPLPGDVCIYEIVLL